MITLDHICMDVGSYSFIALIIISLNLFIVHRIFVVKFDLRDVILVDHGKTLDCIEFYHAY
jgi:hypothetical protein